jgi:alkaline phosphatase D
VGLGVRAWHELFPARPAASEGLYRRISAGAVDLFVLDTRFFRDANADPDDAGKTMLGAAQLAWLQAELLASTAPWKIVATSVPLRYGTTGSDHWEGFTIERSALFSFLTTNAISGVFFLAGDQHWSAVHEHPEGFVEIMACPITADLRPPPSPLPPEVVFVAEAHGYGIVRAAPTSATVEIRGLGGAVLHRVTFP